MFERVYTPAVYTLGAMSSVWTSQYPDRHHSEVSFSAKLPKDRLTLAELLSAQGIHTGGFVANPVAGRLFGFDRGFVDFDEVWSTLGSSGAVFRTAVPPWLAKNRDRRFFAYVHFREPHFPYDPEPPFDTMFGPDGPIPKAMRRSEPFFRDVNQGRRPFSEAEREHLVRLYDGNVAFADQEIGALRRAMEAEGLWEKTVVIVAADHGEELHERGWIGHNVHLYEPSVHVPLIVRFPKGTGPSGLRVPALADLLDLAPTIADVFGVRGKGGSDRAFQGRSLLPVIAGAPRASPRCCRAPCGTARATPCATSASSTSTTRRPARSGCTTSRRTRARRATSSPGSRCARRTTARSSTPGRCSSPAAGPPARSRPSSPASSART